MLTTTTTGPAGERSGCQRYSPGLRSPGIIRSRSRGTGEPSAPTRKPTEPARAKAPPRTIAPRRILLVMDAFAVYVTHLLTALIGPLRTGRLENTTKIGR